MMVIVIVLPSSQILIAIMLIIFAVLESYTAAAFPHDCYGPLGDQPLP